MSEWVNLNKYDHTVGVWTYDRSSIYASLDSFSCYGIFVFGPFIPLCFGVGSRKTKVPFVIITFCPNPCLTAIVQVTYLHWQAQKESI